MYTSGALRHEMATKGNQLLRALVRAFYPPQDSIVIGGLTELSPDNRVVKQDELAAYLNLNNEYISIHLRPFVNDQLIKEELFENQPSYTQIFPANNNGMSLDKEAALRYLVDIYTLYNITKINGQEYTTQQLFEHSLDWLVRNLPNTESLEFPGTDRSGPSTQYTFREDGQIIFMAKISKGKRKERICRYTINYEEMVYSIKYKMLKLQLDYKNRSNPQYYFCPDRDCTHFINFIDSNDLYISSGEIKSLTSLGNTSRQTTNNTSSTTLIKTLGQSNSNSNTIGNGLVQLGTPHVSSQLQALNTGGITPLGQNNNNNNNNSSLSGINNNAQKRSLTNIESLRAKQTTTYQCPRCSTTLMRCGGVEVREEQSQFLAQTNHINQLAHEVFEILKQLRLYELKKLHEQQLLQQSLNPNNDDKNNKDNNKTNGQKSGVGARGGCSTAADLASRVERLKDALPWDELSTADQERLLFEQFKQKQLEEQIARQMKLQEEQAEREKQHREYLELQAKRKRQTALKRAIFGTSGIEDDHDATLLSSFGGNKQEYEQFKTKQEQMLKVDALAQYQYHGNLSPDELSSTTITNQQMKMNPSSDEDPTSHWIYVNGCKVRLEDIDESHLDIMTEDEFKHYSKLMEADFYS